MDLLPVELLTRILSLVPCSDTKQALIVLGTKWVQAIQSQNAHAVRWEPEQYVPSTEDRLGYWTSMNTYGDLQFCSRLLRFEQHVVLEECYLPDISPSSVTSVEVKMDLGKAAICPVFPKVTRVEIAEGFAHQDLHHFFPNLEVLKFSQPCGDVLVLEDLCHLPSLRLIDSDGVWLDCHKLAQLPAGCEVIIYAYNLCDVPDLSQQMTKLSHHLVFVTINDDTFDLAIFCDCVNLKQLNLVWNGIHDLQVNGLAQLPISVAVFIGICWTYADDVDNNKERMRHMLGNTLVDAVMLGWKPRYFKQDMYGILEGYLLQHDGRTTIPQCKLFRTN